MILIEENIVILIEENIVILIKDNIVVLIEENILVLIEDNVDSYRSQHDSYLRYNMIPIKDNIVILS